MSASTGRQAGLSSRAPRLRLVLWLGIGIAVAAAVAGGLDQVAVRRDQLRPRMTVIPAKRGLFGAVAVTVTARHVWVASGTGPDHGSVIELDARDGHWLRTVAGSRYELRDPGGIAADAGHIWVTGNQTGDGQEPKPGEGTVTELDARTGGLVRILSGPQYNFDGATAIAAAGTHIWVANIWGGRYGRGSLKELDARTGRLVRSLSGHGVNDPVALAVRGDDMWVVNDLPEGRGMVAELNATTGRMIWKAAGNRYGFTDPAGIAVSGHRLWITNRHLDGDGGEVTVLDARTGRWIKTLSGGCFGFYSPAGVAIASHRIWVANSYIDATGGSLTELRANDGRWVQTLSSNSWMQNLLNNGCTHYLTTGGYPFANPALIAAVGARIWVFNRALIILTAR